MFLLATMHEMQAKGKVDSHYHLLFEAIKWHLDLTILLNLLVRLIVWVKILLKMHAANYFCSTLESISNVWNVTKKEMKGIINFFNANLVKSILMLSSLLLVKWSTYSRYPTKVFRKWYFIKDKILETNKIHRPERSH
jgi:hypothetical protein